MASRLIAGFALGILAGILIAPAKGSETRKKIAQKGKDLKDNFNDFVESIHERFDGDKEDSEYARELSKPKSPLFSDEAGVWNG